MEKKKLNKFVNSVNNFDNLSHSEQLLLIAYYHIEIEKKSSVTTPTTVRDLFERANIPTPTNFGGEIRKLLRDNKFIKSRNGYVLSRLAKKTVALLLNGDNASTKLSNFPTLSFQMLHPVIQKVSKGLFKDGHYSQSIFEAYKSVVNQVKKISGVKSLDGKPLMERVFSVNNPIIKFNDLLTKSERDEQVGLMLLFSGATLGIRNPKAHDNVIQKDKIRALEYLLFASLLLKRLDERIE